MNDVERVKELREAFRAGVDWCNGIGPLSKPIQDEISRRYPMPVVDVPRVIQDHAGIGWRIVEGWLEWRRGGEWSTNNFPRFDNQRMEIVAALVARPTEQRPADEAHR